MCLFRRLKGNSDSFTIVKDGKYKAVNVYGHISYHGSDLTSVLQSSLFDDDCGSVMLALSGDHFVYDEIEVPDERSLHGFGWGTRLIQKTKGKALIVTNSQKSSTGVHIYNLTLQGADENSFFGTYGINGICRMWTLGPHLRIRGFTKSAIRMFGVGDDWNTQRSYENKLANLQLTNCEESNIIFESWVSDNLVSNVMIAGGRNVGIHFKKGGGTMFSNLHINHCKIPLLIEDAGGLSFSEAYFDGDRPSYRIQEDAVVIKSSKAVGNIEFHNCRWIQGPKTDNKYCYLKLDASNGLIVFVKVIGGFSQSNVKRPKYFLEEVNSENIKECFVMGHTFVPKSFGTAIFKGQKTRFIHCLPQQT